MVNRTDGPNRHFQSFVKALGAFVLIATLAAWGCGGCGSHTGTAGGSDWLAEGTSGEEYQKVCAQVPGCGQPRFEAPGRSETIWRVLVVRTASGEIRIESIDATEVPEGDGVPLGSLGGGHALVGLDRNGRPVDGQPIRFPTTLRVEYAWGESLGERIDVSDRQVDVMGYVRALPSIETIAVLDATGAVATFVPAPPVVGARLERVPLRLAGLSSSTEVLANRKPWCVLPPYCSHVVLLQGEIDSHLAGGIAYEEQVELVRPGPWQVAATEGALARMTPLLCQSIGRIAFGRVKERKRMMGIVTWGTADMMLINVSAGFEEKELSGSSNKQLELQHVVTHEAGHSADLLLTTEGFRADGIDGAWGLPPRTIARQTVDRARLAKGLGDEWIRMHQSFVDHGWASAYPSKDNRKERWEWSTQQVVLGGFMSQYGSMTSWDDIAEFVARSYQAPAMLTGVSREDRACQEMQAHQEGNVPARLAAVYTKLLFLRDLGLVTPEDVQTCTGPRLGVHVDEKGFHFSQGTKQLRKFLNGLEAGIGTTEGGKEVFELRGEGQAAFGDREYPASLTLRLDLGGDFNSFEEVSWPRGIYPLGLFGDNNLLLRLDGAPAGNFNARKGFVLVVEASNDRIAGSIFLTQAFRLHAPIPVPQVFDPPLNIRFLIEH